MKKLYTFLLVTTLICLSLNKSIASHVVGGEITYTCLGQDSYLVKLALYRDCNGIGLAATSMSIDISGSCGAGFTETLYLDSSQTEEISPVCTGQNTVCNGGTIPGMEKYIFEGVVTLPSNCTDWLLSYSLCCRNGAIVNLQAPSSNNIYIDALINNVDAPCNNSPVLNNNPVPYVCDTAVNYSLGAYDPDGDSLVFSLVSARDNSTNPIPYNSPWSGTYPIDNITINPANGELTFNANNPGNYVVVIRVDEYDSSGNLIGYVLRDYQFLVTSCSNIAPVLSSAISNLTGTAVQLDSHTLEMCQGDNFCFDLTFSDANNTDNIILDTAYLQYQLAGNANISLSGTNPLTATICWAATTADTGSIHLITDFRDDYCPTYGQNSEAFEIKIRTTIVGGQDKTICLGNSAQLTASGADTLTWSVISGDPIVVGSNFSCNPCSNPVASPSTTTTYEVTGNNSCSSSDTVTVFVVPDFTLSASGDTTICGNGNVQLSTSTSSSGTPYTYQWSNSASLSNSNIANPVASPLASTTYEVSVTSSQGCTKTDSVFIGVAVFPTFNLIPGNTSICQGDSVQFGVNATGGSEYDDFNGALNNSLWDTVVNGNINNICGSISGDGLHFNGAGNRFARTNNLSPCDSINFCIYLGSGSAPCETLDSTDDVYFQYSTDGGSTWVTIDYYDGTIYSVGTWHCVNYAVPSGAQTANTIFQWTQPTHSGNNFDNWALENVDMKCGDDLTLSYLWSPSGTLTSDTISNPIAFPGSTTTYSLTISDTTGTCSYISNQTVTVSPSFNVSATASSGTICNSGSVNLSATTDSTGSYSYNWSPGQYLNDSTIQNPTATFSSNGTYVFEVWVSNGGCTKMDTTTVTVTGVTAAISSSASITCGPDSVQMEAVVTGAPASCGLSTSGCAGSSSPVIVGTGTLVNSSTGYPAPYGNWYWGSRHQILFTAAELQALGFSGGVINDLSLNVATVNGVSTYNNFEIKMGCTGSADLTSAWETGLVTVFPGQTVNVTTGWNTHVFSNGFNWDGVSNVVVEICFNNGSYTSNSSTFYTTTGFTSVRYYRADNSTVCGSSSVTGISNDRPNIRFGTCQPAGGSGSYSYSWSPSTGLNDPSASNPTAYITNNTTYTVSVTDSLSGCSDTASVFIELGQPFSFTLSSSTDTTCMYDTVQFSATPDTAGTYTYNWYPSANFSDPTIANPNAFFWSPGTNWVYVDVTKNGGCTTTDSMAIEVLQGVTAITSSDTTVTPGSPVILCTSPSGGVSPYSYYWSTGQTTACITVNPTVDYSYTVQILDQCGTSDLDTVTVYMDSTSSSLSLTTSATTASCNGECDGTATVSVLSGTSPYSYFWTGSQTTATATGLCAGTYTVQVIDAGGQSGYATATISEPSPVVVVANPNVSYCAGDTAYLWAYASGGNGGPYSFQWSNGSTDSTQAVLVTSSTTFEVTATDIYGCIAYPDSTTVFINSGLNAWASGDTTISAGDSATVCVSATGGVTPYNYYWNTGETTACITVNPTVTSYYTAQVTDQCGNSSWDTVVVNVGSPSLYVIGSAAPTSCYGECDGTASATVVNGTPPYMYYWMGSTSQNTQTATGLCAGTYMVQVLDAGGQSAYANVTVTEPSPVQVIATPDYNYCAGDTVFIGAYAYGGNDSPYSYQWNNGSSDSTQFVIANSDTTFIVTATDANGCSSIPDSTTISINSNLAITTSGDTTISAGDSLLLCAYPTGGVAPYQYIWSNWNYTACQSVTPTSSTAYTVVVKDLCGTTVEDSLTVTVISLGEKEQFGSNAISVFPNPFAENTTLQLDLIADDNVDVIVYNLIGGQIETINSSRLAAGTHRFSFSGDQASGLYFIQVRIGDQMEMVKVTQVK